jgi:hypothetical protein
MKKEDFTKLGIEDALAQKAADASAEELKGLVPKDRFDGIEAELKQVKAIVAERDAQLEVLKKSTGDSEALKQQITDLQTANAEKDKTHAAEIRDLKRSGIDESLLLEAKAKNLTAVKALLDKVDEAVDEAAYKTLRAEQVKKLTESEDTKFLFDAKARDDKQGQFRGIKPGESRDGGGGGEKPATLADAVKASYEKMTA